MKKLVYSLLCVAGLGFATSCSDYLEVSSPSVVDADFVFSNTTTARAALHGAYEKWRGLANSNVFGAGLFYASDIAGSDMERHPEAFTNQPGRHWPETLYQNGNYTSSYDIDSYNSVEPTYTGLFDLIGKANAVITAMEAMPTFEEIMSAGEPSGISQIYGEAIALRATAYRELIKYFGDVPYQTVFGELAEGLASRDFIYDACIADLIRVEPLMYVLGKAPDFDASAKNYFSQTYVQGLIGRMCLDAAGYQTRRTDLGADFYVNGKGEVITFEKKGTDHHGATYGRRSDWKELYATAKTYLKKVIDNPGTASFVTVDPRSAEGQRQYGNPYQWFFQEMHNSDVGYATESIYEYPQQAGGSTERPYSSGRPSGGGGSKAVPCKSYGQARIQPAFYYGMFDPNDMRRDVSVAVTGSSGAGYEVLLNFAMGSTTKGGGLAMNKFDENRQAAPQVAKQRQSGINGPYMRMSEIYLSYAEVCAATGDAATAKEYLKKIRERAFPAGMADVDGFIADCGGDILTAVIEERAFEFAGEGDRRWTLLRNGLLGDRVKAIKELTKKMIDGLKANGYYEFENGNIISDYVYTKQVDAKTEYGFRLTAQAPDTTDPVLYPGWRGQADDWETLGKSINFSYGTATPATNLAIKGLFEQVDGDALVADGWKKNDWGCKIAELEKEYLDNVFLDWDYTSAPIYLYPYPPTVVATANFVNGYGFQNE